jgi:cytochrome c5
MFQSAFRKIATLCSLCSLYSIFGTLSVMTLSSGAFAMGSQPKAYDEEANTRIAPVARIELAPASTGGKVSDRSGEQIYKVACSACHDTGAANAPKAGDKAAWSSRIGLGLDGLLKSAIAGKNAMPPKGGSDANDIELARAIVFMANKSGASFKEPAAAAK